MSIVTNVFSHYAPARPPTERDVLHLLNGNPVYLGCIASTGTVQDNNNTANPFANAPQQQLVPGQVTNLQGTLAGRMLLIQADAAGSILPESQALGTVGVQTLVVQSSTVVAGTTACGPLLATNERVIILMQPTFGWLQWIPSSGSGNCYVWELV